MPRVTISRRHSPHMSPWSNLDRTEKIKEAILFAGRNGALAITLKMSERMQDLLRGQEKPIVTIRKRMNAALRAFDLHHLPLLLSLEATRPGDVLHLHGVIITNGCSLSHIQTAMRQAVGYIDGHSGSRQFFATEVSYAEGWLEYLLKDQPYTRRLLSLTSKKELWFVSQKMTQAAREDYEAKRRAQMKPANLNVSPASDAI
jgi:hypothetical protein